MQRHEIDSVRARMILDSRGYPTVEAAVILNNGVCGTASVPSGASTGSHEAFELRDSGEDFGGKNVKKAVANVNNIISRVLHGRNATDQQSIDTHLIEADGTENKSTLGANAILAVSLSCARACANTYKIPLYRYLGGINAVRMPVPMMNILNGGAHAANPLDIQEFMIVPEAFDTFSDSLKAGVEVYQMLKSILKKENLSISVGDEGGFAPEISDTEKALDLITDAINKAGYSGKIKLALDAAASEWSKSTPGSSEIIYSQPKSKIDYNAASLCLYFEKLCNKYPVISLEDPLGEDDFNAWHTLTANIGNRVDIVGDDLFVTNPRRLRDGIKQKCGNAVLVKVNQIGTLSEAMDVVRIAKDNGYKTVISHRSGETADTYIADIAVALGSERIKTGAPCRSERTEKYNRLLKIEQSLYAPEFGSRIIR